MAFSITPASGYPPTTPDEFPNFIQFQSGGSDLGGPDADVLNFGDGLSATRGVGENANKVTVQAIGGGGAAEELLISASGIATFQGF